jgi:hypothetical protein
MQRLFLGSYLSDEVSCKGRLLDFPIHSDPSIEQLIFVYPNSASAKCHSDQWMTHAANIMKDNRLKARNSAQTSVLCMNINMYLCFQIL